MLHADKPTRTEETKTTYIARTGVLTRKCRKELDIYDHETLDYRQLIGWMIDSKNTWSRATWRQYKSSVLYFLENEISKNNDSIAQEAYDQLFPVGTEGCVKKTKKTSGSKLKKIPLKDLTTILYYLDKNKGRHKWYEPLRRWLTVSVLTGLRPIEWADAEIVNFDGEMALSVKNAKHTNGRAHGEKRTIIVSDLKDGEISDLKKHVEYCNEWNNAGQFNSLYTSCSKALKRACKEIWPNRSIYPCLYSARHQFSADAKASGLLREEIAALMGHAVDDTATIHYGKKTAGMSHTRVRAVESEVLKVRQVYEERYIGPNEPKPKQVNDISQKPSKNNIAPTNKK